MRRTLFFSFWLGKGKLLPCEKAMGRVMEQGTEQLGGKGGSD